MAHHAALTGMLLVGAAVSLIGRHCSALLPFLQRLFALLRWHLQICLGGIQPVKKIKYGEHVGGRK
jgi:hypothetical protein